MTGVQTCALPISVSILLVLVATFDGKLKNDKVVKGATYATLTISILTVVDSLGISIGFVHKLPLASFGFNWIVPAIVGGLIGLILTKKENNELDEERAS